MFGSHVVGGWIAQGVFWIVLVVGFEELGPKRVAVFAGLWLAGYLASRWFVCAALGFVPFVALLDVVLVLLVFKRDLRLR